MHTLYFMGEGEPEAFRCRVYSEPTELERQHRAFVATLADGGVIDCPAYDTWIESLDARGWLTSEMEPNPDGPGRVKRLRLSEFGRSEWARMKEG